MAKVGKLEVQHRPSSRSVAPRSIQGWPARSPVGGVSAASMDLVSRRPSSKPSETEITVPPGCACIHDEAASAEAKKWTSSQKLPRTSDRSVGATIETTAAGGVHILDAARAYPHPHRPSGRAAGRFDGERLPEQGRKGEIVQSAPGEQPVVPDLDAMGRFPKRQAVADDLPSLVDLQIGELDDALGDLLDPPVYVGGRDRGVIVKVIAPEPDVISIPPARSLSP